MIWTPKTLEEMYSKTEPAEEYESDIYEEEEEVEYSCDCGSTCCVGYDGGKCCTCAATSIEDDIDETDIPF